MNIESSLNKQRATTSKASTINKNVKTTFEQLVDEQNCIKDNQIKYKAVHSVTVIIATE